MALRILFAEDDARQCELHQRHIEEAGYECLKAANGREAIAAVEREKPHLVVMDMLTPEMDGLAVLLALKRSPTTKMLPTILLADESNYYRASIVQFTAQSDLLTKPFAPKQLLNAIRRLLSAAVS